LVGVIGEVVIEKDKTEEAADKVELPATHFAPCYITTYIPNYVLSVHVTCYLHASLVDWFGCEVKGTKFFTDYSGPRSYGGGVFFFFFFFLAIFIFFPLGLSFFFLPFFFFPLVFAFSWFA
jgi:hypothetical protein